MAGNLLSQIPQWIKTVGFAGGFLLSAFAGRLPGAIQDTGLGLGVVLMLVCGSAFLLHLGRESRRKKSSMLPVVGMAISALAFIGFGVWYYIDVKSSNTKPIATAPQAQPPTNSSIGDESVVMGKVSPNLHVGDKSVVIGATDNHGNTILNTPMAVGYDAHAGPDGIAIGAHAGSANTPALPKPILPVQEPSVEQLFKAQTLGRYGGIILHRAIKIDGGISVPILLAVSADSEANSKFASFMVLAPETPASPFSDWQLKAWGAIADQFDEFEKMITLTVVGTGSVGLGPNSMMFSKQIYLYTYGTMNYKSAGEISKRFEDRGLRVLDVRNSDWLWNRRDMLRHAIIE